MYGVMTDKKLRTKSWCGASSNPAPHILAASSSIWACEVGITMSYLVSLNSLRCAMFRAKSASVLVGYKNPRGSSSSDSSFFFCHSAISLDSADSAPAVSNGCARAFDFFGTTLAMSYCDVII